MDPAMDIVGRALVACWSWRLPRDTGSVLLDRQSADPADRAVAHAIEGDGRLRLLELHLWSIGPGYRAVIGSAATSGPCQVSEVESLIPDDLGPAHLTIELRPGQAAAGWPRRNQWRSTA